MNQQALLDGVLAGVALWAAWGPGRALPALRLGAALLAAAAVLGTLKFSGLLPLPELHQSMSMFAAGVGLPLLGVAMVWPDGVVARERRYAWIFGVAAAVMCVLVAVVGGIKLWPSVCALLAVVAMGLASSLRRQWWGAAAAACMLLALVGFAAKRNLGPLAPGDVLHVGLALGLWLYAGWVRQTVGTGALGSQGAPGATAASVADRS
ncbi:MAG: hypothetical protein FJX55_12645 [Alphaproteobacteria bacterium]|nr:hypothetical protein [Alphaproteobacteria bacterium]